ncbi:MAG: XRE family transcriptional regulator [Syntrophorhabdus aromaticivorans]|uniref:XRE family transcriptional regulator n=1 Tax=Syntrophorhabdus aromaticivorans TaxID=328301 RepID=A0A971M6P3_9BACT|nr:XRE family transcriptional regulator [Syntrophorhabdus aromaticivorans]
MKVRIHVLGEWRVLYVAKLADAIYGNVFIDLGYSPDEAAILQMRADLMSDIRKLIKAKKLTQAKAGMRVTLKTAA